MRHVLKISLFAVLPAIEALSVEAADPFGRVERSVEYPPAAVEPAPQVFINPYGAAPAANLPARLPSTRLEALRRVVGVARLNDAYPASTSAASIATPGGNSYTVAPRSLPANQGARPLTPAASANAPASIARDRAVVPATYQTLPGAGVSNRFDSGANPLRRAEMPTNGSTNPLR
jgi:hypothetical protein